MFLLNTEEVKHFLIKNIDKIPDSIKSHPPNRENISKWIEMHKKFPFGNAGSNLMFLAQIIASFITHISYDDFLIKLNDICLELKSLSLTGHKLYIFFPILATPYKSYSFVNILISHILLIKYELDISFFLQNRPFIGFSSSEFTVDTEEKNLFIIGDDASYTGSQLTRLITHIFADKNCSLFLAVPYMSNKAKTKILEECKNIVFSSNTVFFDTIREHINKSYRFWYNTNFVSLIKYNKLLEYNLLYFDFKMPDNLSIPWYMLIYGYSIDESNSIAKNDNAFVRVSEYDENALSLISGCDGFAKPCKTKGFNPNRVSGTANNCIVSFYRKIEWIWNLD